MHDPAGPDPFFGDIWMGSGDSGTDHLPGQPLRQHDFTREQDPVAVNTATGMSVFDRAAGAATGGVALRFAVVSTSTATSFRFPIPWQRPEA